MHHEFIVNPVAGKGRALQMVEKIKSRFRDFSQTCEIRITEAPGHAQELAKDAVSKGGDVRLYSVGGDGTLNEVINGMAGSNLELGIIPCGSGNDAARSLYSVTDPVKLIELLPVSPTTMVDVGKFNEKYFINIASIGFDADVVLKSRKFKGFPLVSGPLSYILGVLAALFRLKKYRLKLSIGNSLKVEKDILLSIFANGAYYGGGMKAAPRARMDDGILDFYLVDAVPRSTILKLFQKFKNGEHESLDVVSMYRSVNAVIESDEPFPVNIDGEVSMEDHAVIDILPKFLNVIVPRTS